MWHLRLGHVNFKATKLLSDNKMTRGLPKLVQPKKVYTGCLMAKQTRRSFPNQVDYHATKVLELIHADLCRPRTPDTKVHNKYFLLLVDDFSRLM